MSPVILRRRKLGRTSCREIAAFSKTGIVSVRNDQPFPDGHDLVIRWGTTSNLPYKAKVLNEAKGIHWVADKATSRKIMADAGLAPETYLTFEEWYDAHNGMDFAGPIGGPWVVRKNVHSQGKHLLFCHTNEEVEAACEVYGEGGYYISTFVDKVAEYRVLVGSGRVVWVAKKTPADPNAVAWNVAQGGRFDNVRWGEWPLEAIRVAIEAWKLSGLDFGGVDVMVDADGRAYVLEINSAPSQTSPYRQECMAKYFDYIVENNADHFNVERYNDWKDVIHPALSEHARV
jgi:glutathione synthase/RimK-type ligase-like ATP-grasp enzyme